MVRLGQVLKIITIIIINFNYNFFNQVLQRIGLVMLCLKNLVINLNYNFFNQFDSVSVEMTFNPALLL